MTLYKELSLDGDACVSKIKGIQFCILGPEEIRRRSVAEITTNESYDKSEPVLNGLFDTRMGVIDNNRICRTCEQRNTFCPGHFGHIDLARPVFFVQFFGIVQKLLKCVCFRCSKLLVDTQEPAVRAVISRRPNRMKRWDAMHKMCANVKRCGKETLDGCGARQPDRVTKSDAMKILMEWKDLGDDGESQARRQVFGASDVLKILKRITDADAEALGFAPRYVRPEWLVCSTLPVPPPCVRPSVRNDLGVRKEDDLTHKLGDIIKFNNTVRSKIDKGASFDAIEWPLSCLQQHVATLVDNSGAYMTKDRTGRVFKTISDRLNRKDGRIRGNLIGKRVDFSARTVITPDPNISIDELGVPLRIAMNLTFPEVVNRFNYERLRAHVLNGPDAYPGAKHVRKGTRTVRLRGNDLANFELEPGDVVERHLVNGDYVLFNRQPSLHKMSMMAHRVRVMAHNTFRLNVCVCASYNADFDGDEMNMHVPQSLQSHEEIRQLAAVPLHVISPRHSKPIISIVQDVALGVYRITQESVRVTPKQYCNLMAGNIAHDCRVPLGDVTGRELMSSVVPPETYVSLFQDKTPDDPDFLATDHHVLVDGGVLRSGVLTTKAFNDPARGLIRRVINDGGPEAVTLFLDNTQKLVCDWLVLSGFSVGIADLLIPQENLARIRQHVADLRAGFDAHFAKLHAGTLKNVSTVNNRAFFEGQVDALGKTCIAGIEKAALAGIDPRSNNMFNMIRSGSKGQVVNLVQMLASLGQQVVDGGRIPDGFDNRTLPHFTKYDDGPASRGFVEHSFLEGLSPHEFFFHSMAGRIGLIDTAVRSVTRETELLVLEGAAPRLVQIGDWVDARMDASAREAQGGHRTTRDPSGLEHLSVDDVRVPTVDDEGRVFWGTLSAVTRHDPGERLFRVLTMSGRSVTVAESQSLIVWDAASRRLVERESGAVRRGDLLPVSLRLEAPCAPVQAVQLAGPWGGATLALDRVLGIGFGIILAAGELTATGLSVAVSSEMARSYISTWVRVLWCQIRVAEWTPASAPGSSIPAAREVAGSLEFELPPSMSSLLSRVLDRGTSHVPSLAFVGPLDFVTGLLDGYIESAPDVAPVGLGLLCARAGLFFDGVGFAQPEVVAEDVVLDAVASITPVPADPTQKLYDLTVPETLNFVLANGLGVRDTSETGYIQRRLIMFMQDLKVCTDLSVRNSSGQVVQLLYGEDGCDATHVEYQSLPHLEMEVADIRHEHLILDVSELEGAVVGEVLAAPLDPSRMRAHFDAILDDRARILGGRQGHVESHVLHPVNIASIVATASRLSGTRGLSDIHPHTALDLIASLIEDLSVVEGRACAPLMQALLRYHLSPKAVVLRHALSRDALDAVAKAIRSRFRQSVVHPGEMVGILAAQSIGEPTTQTTLNTFHLAGVGAASITTQQGVPRLQELFGATKTKKIKTPYMRIYLDEAWRTDMDRCRDVCSLVETTRFRDLVRRSRVYFDPPAGDDHGEDNAMLEALSRFEDAVSDARDRSPWVIRLEFDRVKLADARVSMMDMEIVLRQFYDDVVDAVFSDDNAADLVARVRLNESGQDEDDALTDVRALQDSILNTVVVKGIKQIVRAVPLKPTNATIFDPATSSFAKQTEWSIETSGSNLFDVLAMPHVDARRTQTNDVDEVYTVLGVEAARQALYNELQSVMWQKDTNSVNYRHMGLLVDAMTARGIITSVNRHGINKGDIGPLAKSSFERVSEMLIQAGVFAEHDRISGVAANIILGHVAPCGTGDSEIFLDEDMLARLGTSVTLEPRKNNEAEKEKTDAVQAMDMPAHRGTVDGRTRDNINADDVEIV